MEELDLQQLLRRAQELGAEEVEIFYEESIQNDLEIYDKQVESLESAQEKGLGIRVFIEEQMGFAYTSNFTDQALEEAIEEAIANADVASEDENRTLPAEEFEYSELNIYNSDLSDREIEEKIELALEMEEVALEYSDQIESVTNVNYGDYDAEVQIVNSRGLAESYRTNGCYVSISVIAADEADQQTGYSFAYGRDLEQLTPEATAEEAAANALKLLGGSQVASQSVPIVFTPRIGSMLMYVLSRALTAEAVQKGRSLFADKLNQQVASGQVQIIDDGTLQEGLTSAPFDDEGVPCTKTEVIKNGKLVNFLYDTYTANKAEVASTGNAQRGGYWGIPGVAPTNFYLAPGEKSKEEIIQGVEEGFYVHKVSGLVTGGANPISGEISVGATGQWIKDGEIQQPVSEVTIAGNMIELLKGIVEIGDDMKLNPMLGSFGSPTFKVEELAISGE